VLRAAWPSTAASSQTSSISSSAAGAALPQLTVSFTRRAYKGAVFNGKPHTAYAVLEIARHLSP